MNHQRVWPDQKQTKKIMVSSPLKKFQLWKGSNKIITTFTGGGMELKKCPSYSIDSTSSQQPAEGRPFGWDRPPPGFRERGSFAECRGLTPHLPLPPILWELPWILRNSKKIQKTVFANNLWTTKWTKWPFWSFSLKKIDIPFGGVLLAQLASPFLQVQPNNFGNFTVGGSKMTKLSLISGMISGGRHGVARGPAGGGGGVFKIPKMQMSAHFLHFFYRTEFSLVIPSDPCDFVTFLHVFLGMFLSNFFVFPSFLLVFAQFDHFFLRLGKCISIIIIVRETIFPFFLPACIFWVHFCVKDHFWRLFQGFHPKMAFFCISWMILWWGLTPPPR